MEYKKCKDEFLKTEDEIEFFDVGNIKEDNDPEQNIEILKNKKKKQILICTYPGCKMKFDRLLKFNSHVSNHTGERQFVCDVDGCDKAYARNAHLKRHKLSHKPESKKQFPCKFCDLKFTERHNLKRHCSVLHEKQGYFLKTCEECSIVCPTREKLREHMAEVHNRKLYLCHMCSKSFHEQQHLRRHLNSSIHQVLKQQKKEQIVVNKEFTCDYCGKMYGNRNRIIQHLKSHEQKENFPCPHDGCKQVYDYQRNLDSHIRLHHMDIKFQCDLCPRKLSTKQKLIEHVMKIHDNPAPRKQPATKENRNARWDINIPRKSAVSKLCGIKLPPAMEKIIINRHNEENVL